MRILKTYVENIFLKYNLIKMGCYYLLPFGDNFQISPNKNSSDNIYAIGYLFEEVKNK